MKASAVHKLTDQELPLELEQLTKKLFDLRNQMVTQKLDNPCQWGALKRDVARIKTEITLRQAKSAKVGA